MPLLRVSVCSMWPVVTRDLGIVQNEKFRDLLRKDPKFREPVSFSWHQNYDIIMDACKAYARQWAKKEDVELFPNGLSRSVMY